MQQIMLIQATTLFPPISDASPPTRWMLFFPLFFAPNICAASAALINSAALWPSNG